jgi:hypothetical protein
MNTHEFFRTNDFVTDPGNGFTRDRKTRVRIARGAAGASHVFPPQPSNNHL